MMIKPKIVVLSLIAFFTIAFSTPQKVIANGQAEDNGQSLNNYQFSLPEGYDQLKNYRSKWSRLTGFEFSGLHWSNYVVIYVNKDIKTYRKNYLEYLRLYRSEDDEDEDDEDDGLDENQFQGYEVGTVFIKENYSSEKNMPSQPTSLTIMVKKNPGYDSQGGDWEYLQFSPSGSVIMQGKTNDQVVYKECAKCHGNMKERDYIFSTFYIEQGG